MTITVYLHNGRSATTDRLPARIVMDMIRDAADRRMRAPYGFYVDDHHFGFEADQVARIEVNFA